MQEEQEVYLVRRRTGHLSKRRQKELGTLPVRKAKRLKAPIETQTVEGLRKGSTGDWAIQDRYGNWIPVPPADFQNMYEVVNVPVCPRSNEQ
jgi:hypothetical protein